MAETTISRVESLKESRKGAAVIFTHLLNAKKRFDENIFCLFEGEDSKYYIPRIEKLTGYSQDKLSSFTCGGKAEVKRLLRLVENSDDLERAKTVFFVDRDFDKPLEAEYHGKIYETSCYSIENFYSRLSSFLRILRCEFMYNESHDEYEIIKALYEIRQSEFHREITLFNAWIACQRDYNSDNPQSRSRAPLSSFKLTTFIPVITINSIVSNYDLQKIENSFREAAKIPQETLDKKLEEFRLHPEKGNLFRGKFEIHFLRKFVDDLLSEVRSKSSVFLEIPGVYLVMTDNILSQLSQYAETPEDLAAYLVQRIAA